jgi:O-antigen ligase
MVLKLLFGLILIIFPFGQLLRLPMPAFLPAVRIQPLDLTVFLFVLTWALENLFSRTKLVLPSFFRAMAVFGLIASASLLLRLGFLPAPEFLSALLYLLRLWNYFFFYLALVDFIREEQISIVSYIFGSGVVIALLAVAQYFLLPDTRFLFNLGWDDHYFRAIGSFLDPGFTGILLALSLLTAVVDFLDKSEGRQSLVFLGGLLLLLALGLSFSRASYLILVLGLGLTFFFHKRFKLYMIVSLFFALVVFLLPKPGGEGVNLFRVSSFVARSDNYSQVWQIIREHPLTGVGYNAYRFAQRDYGFLSTEDWANSNAGAGADNSFLLVWATTGLFGFIAFVYLWWLILSQSFLEIRNQRSGLLLFVFTICLTVAATVINCLFYPWILVWLMIILARFTVESEGSTQFLTDSLPDPNR